MTWVIAGYTEIRSLGHGASGRVVLATHDGTGQHVAIKYLADHLALESEFVSNFRAEARILSELENPQIAQLYQYIEAPEGAAIVMELVDGVALRAILREHGPTEPQAALLVLKGSLLGLAAAHASGIVHRDYKPENILVGYEGQSKLADFGIAARAGRHGVPAGTPSYMAPEQWEGAPATPATDIYAATATFFECLTGRPPFVAPGDLPGLRQLHHQAPIPAELVSEEVRGLIKRGLAKNLAHRPQDAATFVRELDAVASAGYGEDWEEEGRGALARRAALLLLLFPLAKASPAGTGIGKTILGTSKNAVINVIAAVGAVIAVLAGYLVLSDDKPAAGPQLPVRAVTSPGISASGLPAPGPSFVESASASPSTSPAQKPPSSPAPRLSTLTPQPAPNTVLRADQGTARWCGGSECPSGNNRFATASARFLTSQAAAYQATFRFQPVSPTTGQPVPGSTPVVKVVSVSAGQTLQTVSADWADLDGTGCYPLKVHASTGLTGPAIVIDLYDIC